MAKTKRKMTAQVEPNLDLFDAGSTLQPLTGIVPQPGSTIPADTQPVIPVDLPVITPDQLPQTLPDEAELARRYDFFNLLYFEGRLPRVRIEYSNRLRAAGSFTPADQLIRIGRKYHEIFPEDVDDTLKHEMIHLIHLNHNADFKREAERIGTSLRARSHPVLRRPPRYVYGCPGCGRTYPRQKRLRMASCGRCSAKGKYDERFKLRLLKSNVKPAGRRA